MTHALATCVSLIRNQSNSKKNRLCLAEISFFEKTMLVFIRSLRNVFTKKFIFICNAYQSKISFIEAFANAWSANCFWFVLCRTLSVILIIMLFFSWTNKMLWFDQLFDEKNRFQFCFVLFYVFFWFSLLFCFFRFWVLVWVWCCFLFGFCVLIQCVSCLLVCWFVGLLVGRPRAVGRLVGSSFPKPICIWSYA